MRELSEATQARVKQLLKKDIPSALTTEDFELDKVIEPMLRYVYALGWAHAEERFASDYFDLEMQLMDPGAEWDDLRKLAKKPRPNDDFPDTKQDVLTERARELVELMRTEHDGVLGALLSLPTVKGGLPGRAEALIKKNKEALVGLKALVKKTAAKKKKEKTVAGKGKS